MDERKQKLVSNRMTWGFIMIVIAIIIVGKAGIESNLRDFVEIGFWILIVYISLITLYQNIENTEREEI